MKVKELKDLIVHFTEDKYSDYEIVFWDWARQRKMDGHFGGLSHPEKEISIPIHVVGEKNWIPAKKTGYPEEVPSPFVEDGKAFLKEEKNYTFDGLTFFTRYFYEDEKTEKHFTNAEIDTATMLNYWIAEAKRLRKEIKELKGER